MHLDHDHVGPITYTGRLAGALPRSLRPRSFQQNHKNLLGQRENWFLQGFAFMANPTPLPSPTGPASATQARDARKPQSQKPLQAPNENDSDAALDTSSNTKSSETANGRSDSGHKQDGKEAQNGESCLKLCRLSKRRSDVEKLLETSKAVIDIREDSGDTLIVVDTAVLDIASLERLLGCEAKRGRDVLHCTQENASSDTGKILLSEIRDELRFCETALHVRRAGAESAFKCYEMTAKACGVYDVWDVWNERAGEENENAGFVARFNIKMNADNINKVTEHGHPQTWQRRLYKAVSDAVAKL